MSADGQKAPSFESFATEFRAPLERYLGKFVGDRHLAEDLLQDTLLKISRGLQGFRGESSLKTWAFRIATRTAIDHLRRSQNGQVPVDPHEGEALPDDFDLVGERIVIREMNSCIRQEIDGLPEDYRAAILLHDLEGLTAAETAEITGCSLATAKIRIHRARIRLREVLERDCDFYYGRDQVLRCDQKKAGEEA